LKRIVTPPYYLNSSDVLLVTVATSEDGYRRIGAVEVGIGHGQIASIVVLRIIEAIKEVASDET
jgi:hypothetical protein